MGIDRTDSKAKKKNVAYREDMYCVQPVPGGPVITEDDGACGGDKSMITVMKGVIFYWLKETRMSIIQMGGMLTPSMIGTFKRLSK